MGLSTYQPLFLIKETVSKYRRSKSPLYVVSLDAEKAFDSLWRKGLFFKLIDKIDQNLWFILHEYYNQSDGIIMINESHQSDIFAINKGVKQGGVLSPFLFNTYINDLIVDINRSNYGCYLNNFKISILGYCDDIILVSSSLSNIQILLDLCQNYFEIWNIKFNANKSIAINAGLKLYEDDKIDLFINSNKINVVESSKYLGLIINKNNDGNEPTLDKYRCVEKSFFSLNSFGIKPPGINPFMKAFIYNSYCLPKCTYGMGIFNLSKKTIKTINVAQNNLFRYALGIPYKTHISLIMKALNIVDANTLYYSQICILVKLLHRHNYTKSLLMSCLDNPSNSNLDLYDDIKCISNLLNIDVRTVIEYPDKTRDLLIANYLDCADDQHSIERIKMLLNDYSIENKRILIQLSKINYTVNIETQQT